MEWGMWHRVQGRWRKANGTGRKESIGRNGKARQSLGLKTHSTKQRKAKRKSRFKVVKSL